MKLKNLYIPPEAQVRDNADEALDLSPSFQTVTVRSQLAQVPLNLSYSINKIFINYF